MTWFVLALAQEPRGLMVMVRDPDGLLGGEPRVAVTDATGRVTTIAVGDDGAEADMAASDGVWSGAGRDLVGPDYEVTLSDGTRTWISRLTAPKPHEPTLSFQPTAEGSLVLADARPPGGGPARGGGEPQAAAPSTSTEGPSERGPEADDGDPGAGRGGTDQGVPSSWAYLSGWVAVLSAVAWLLAGGRRGALPAAVPGPRPELPARGLAWVEGDADALVAQLARQNRVVLVGRPPTREVPHGTVFALGPGRVAVADVVGAVRALRDSGPAVVVVVSGRLDTGAGTSHQEAVEQLAQRLPRGSTVCAFGGTRTAWLVGPDGALSPVEAGSSEPP